MKDEQTNIIDQEQFPGLDIGEPLHPMQLIPTGPKGQPKYTTLWELKELLNSSPRKRWIKANKYSNNAKYIPIRITEELLGSIFPAWETRIIDGPKILGNCVVVSVNLRVFNPILGEWLTYSGTGACPIELEKDAAPTDFTKIKPKALHKNVPAALGFATSNAAKKLGKIFGSHLNSKHDETIY